MINPHVFSKILIGQCGNIAACAFCPFLVRSFVKEVLGLGKKIIEKKQTCQIFGLVRKMLLEQCQRNWS